MIENEKIEMFVINYTGVLMERLEYNIQRLSFNEIVIFTKRNSPYCAKCT